MYVKQAFTFPPKDITYPNLASPALNGIEKGKGYN